MLSSFITCTKNAEIIVFVFSFSALFAFKTDATICKEMKLETQGISILVLCLPVNRLAQIVKISHWQDKSVPV